MPPFAPELIIVLFLIVLNGAFAMSEMAIVSSRKVRLQQLADAGDSRARLALELANDPNQLLSTIQIGITLIGIINGAFGGATLSTAISELIALVPVLAPYSGAIGFGLVVSIITYLSLVVGELVPKRLALNNPERVAIIVARPMRSLSTIAGPLVRLLSVSNDLLLRLLGVQAADDAPVTEDEIKLLIHQATRAGVFHEEEFELVERVFRLGDARAGTLMTPRHEVIWLDVDAPLDAVRQVMHDSGHAQMPVARGSLDDIVGVIRTSTMLAYDWSVEPFSLAKLVDPAVFIPDTMHAFRVMEELRVARVHVVIVIDEYGGVQGIMTPGNILAAIVGEIGAADDDGMPAVRQLDDASWSVDAMLTPDELEDATGIGGIQREEHAPYRSLGGLIMAELGRIPEPGDMVERAGSQFEVLEMDRNRVSRILVRRPQADGEPVTGTS